MSSAAWRTCQSRSVAGPSEGGGDLGGPGVAGVDERRQGEHGAAADRRPVGRWRRGWRRARGRRRSPRARRRRPRARAGRAGTRRPARSSASSDSSSPTPRARRTPTPPPRRRPDRRRRAGRAGRRGVAGGRSRRRAGAPPGRGRRRRRVEPVVVEHAEPLERAEGGRPAPRDRRRGEPGSRRRHVAGVPGDGDGAPVDHRHCFSRSVSVVTIHARLNAVTVASTAPMTSASPELATTAHTRRSGAGGVVRRATASRTS